MRRAAVVVLLTGIVSVGGCNVIAAIAAPKIKSVTVVAPAGLLVGETAQAAFHAFGDDGKDHQGRPVKWKSSDPTALSIDAQGKMTALIGGRTVTISAEVDGKTGTATVAVASNDNRMGYALADQPTAAGTYEPNAATRYNSSGGTIDVTRSATGVYSVRFAGLGRAPGQRDNVQVAAYNGTLPVYCKPASWDAAGADLRVAVNCLSPNGVPTDSPFTILALGAWAIGRAEPIGFLLNVVDSNQNLDSSATARNSTGGHVAVGYNSEGNYSVNFDGVAATWAGRPGAFILSASGSGPRRCEVIAEDPTIPGFGINCFTIASAPGNAPFSLLWLSHGRPSLRFGFASPQNPFASNLYEVEAASAINSSGGSVTSRKTSAGHYHVVFAGLARPAGGTETVLVSPLLLVADRVCNTASWGNSAADLFVDVVCFTPSGTATDTRFGVIVIQ
jgi:hypothetical protein